MTTSTWAKNGSGDGLLPNGTKTMLGTKFTYHQRCFLVFAWELRGISQEVFINLIHNKCSHVIKLQPHIPGVNVFLLILVNEWIYLMHWLRMLIASLVIFVYIMVYRYHLSPAPNSWVTKADIFAIIIIKGKHDEHTQVFIINIL